MRALLLLVLFAGPAFAVDQVVFPALAGNTRHSVGVANTLYCSRVPAPASLTGATKIWCRITGGAAASTSGCALYPDADGSTELIEATGSSAAAGNLPGTAASFNIVEGTVYRVCVCSTSTSVTWLGIADLASSGTTRTQQLWNGVTANSSGTAANGCTSGDPPATTGALTGQNTTHNTPLVIVE